MSLGVLSAGDGKDVVFQVSADLVRTWQEMKRSGESRWHEHEVYGAKPVAEFIGPGLDTITFSVRLDADRGTKPTAELKNLRLLRDTGVVSQFTVGGELVGDFTIKSLAEDLRRFDGKGRLLTGIVEITLREYA